MKIIFGILFFGVIASVHAENVIENSFSGNNTVVITSGDSQSIVNGVAVSGNNITVINGVVYADGKKISVGTGKQINIVVNGNAQSINTSTGKVTVNGNVEQVKTTSGDVQAKNINGDVSTTSGDVEAAKITGKVSTLSGQINQK